MSYSVYILRMKDGRYYVGMTSDLERRSAEHGVKAGTRTTKIFGCEEVLSRKTIPTALPRISANNRSNGGRGRRRKP